MAAKLREQALLRFLRDPEGAVVGFRIQDWSDALRAARRSNLLSRVACLATGSVAYESLPLKVIAHLEGALHIAESNSRFVQWEVRQVQAAFAEDRIPFALLKGAAYIVAGLGAGQGRLLSDIDILVPQDRLAAAERAVIQHGWITTKIDAYDQRYYRDWMHELPPMQHLGRGTSLDVHHTILPPTSSPKPDLDSLWRAMRPLPSVVGCSVLGPEDMVLHSATHLFYDGDMRHGLRDLVDVDALLRSFSTQPQFWQKLVARAEIHGLARPLYYALEHCSELLDTPVPEDAMREVRRLGAPPAVLAGLMHGLIRRSVGSVLEDAHSTRSAAAEFLMFVRSHYLRMPLRQLVPHLLRKQFVSDAR